MSQSPPPQNPLFRLLHRFLSIARQPKNIVIGATSITIVLVGYTGLRLFLQAYLPPFLEKQVSEVIKRPIKIGKLKGFSLTQLYLESTLIPATPDHPNQFTANKVIIGFDPLAIVLRRTLIIKVTPSKIEGYIRQNAQGDWLNLEATDEPIPISLDLTLNLKNTNLSIFAYQSSNPLKVKLKGLAQYTESEDKKIKYDLNLGLIDKEEIRVEGETFLETTKSQIKLTIKKLSLSQFSSFIPNFPLQWQEGNLQADLDLNIPSLKDFQGTQGQGKIEVGNIQGQVKSFKNPLKALVKVSFEGGKVLVEKAQVRLGKIITDIQGEYDWNLGSNFQINVKNISAANIRETLPVSLPVEVEGELKAQLKLTGTIQNPLLIGKIENNNTLRLAKTEINNISANFKTNFDTFFLQRVSFKPKAGGEIIGQGNLRPNLLKSLVEKTSIDWKKIPFEFTFKTELPSKKLINVYYKLPEIVNIRALKAQGKFKGSIADLQGIISWQNAANLNQVDTSILSKGDILIRKNSLIINNTEIATNQGKVIVEGSGSLATKTWQVYFNANSFTLTPFAAIFCQNKLFNCPQNLTLETGNIRVSGKLDKPPNESINLDSTLSLSVDGGKVVVNSQSKQGKLSTSVTALQLPITPLLPQLSIPVTLANSRLNLTSDLANLWKDSTLNLNAMAGTGNAQLEIANSTINATGKLQGESFEAIAHLNSLSLNQILPQLTLPVSLEKSAINLSTNLRSLFLSSNKPNLNALQVKANTELAIANKTITAKSQLNQGIITVNASANPRSIAPLTLAGYPSIQVKKVQVNLTANLPSLLSLNLSSLKGYTETELGIAQGNIRAVTQIHNNKVQSNIDASNVDASKLNLPGLTPSLSGSLEAKINVATSLNSILASESLLPLQANNLFIKIGEQTLRAKGNLLLSNLWKKPDIKKLTLTLATQTDLKTLPISQLLDQIPIKRQLLPETIELTGKGNFRGNLVGKNLLTSPLSPGNLQLIGNLTLLGFSFNKLSFDPNLTGRVAIESGKTISLNLRGKKDIIAASFDPCLQANCFLPYLIQSFEIRQNGITEDPIIAQGNRQGDRLVAKVENFPIELLRIAPLRDYGLVSYLGGALNIDAEINPYTLDIGGKLSIADPRFGKIVGNKFEAAWVYQDSQFLLENTLLQLGKSSYNIAGAFNLKSGEVEGKLNVNQGYIQDILTALEISDWDSLLRLLQLEKPGVTNAQNITPNPVGNGNNPLSDQINLFWENDRKIQKMLEERQGGALPEKLDIQGEFQAAIALGGTLKDPQVSVQFAGDRWQWTTQPPTPSIIKSLGLVLEGSQVIPIEKLVIEGKLENGLIKLNPSVKLGGTLAKGTLNLGYQDPKFYIYSSDFKVDNLTLDIVRNLLVIPGDINGIVNLEGSLDGPLTQPKIQGGFEFKEGSINARLLNQDLVGKFGYTNNQLQVQTTHPESIQVKAYIPFPIEANYNDRFEIKAKLGSDAFSLLQPLTFDQVTWLGGKGSINLDVSGRLFIDNQIKISLDPDSQMSLTLEGATLANDLLPDPLTFDGQINLENGRIKVKELVTNLEKRTLTATGILPLFPLSPDDSPIDTPLTLKITQNEVNQEGIYQGIMQGQVLITGSLISPILGGEIRFTQGKLILPRVPQREATPPIFKKWIGTLTPRGGVFIPPKLNNFRVLVEEMDIEQTKIRPKFFFNVSGDLSLNGQLNDLSLADVAFLEPSGTLTINSGQVDILPTRVFLTRQHRNTITFSPQFGLLNPYIDLEVKLYTFLVSLRTINDNEITDDIVRSGRARSAEITLGILGNAAQLLPDLSNQLKQTCQLRPQDEPPIAQSSNISEEKLKQLADCIIVSNLGANSIGDLLRSPIVSFSSNPPLTNSELLTLFSNQRSDLQEQLQQRNSTQLIEAGLPQVVVVLLPFLQDLLFDFNEDASESGKGIGLEDLRLFPVLDTVYKLDNNSLIRFSYDYGFNEATIRYETKF